MVTGDMHRPEFPLHLAGEIVAELIRFNGISRLQLRIISSIWGQVFESCPHAIPRIEAFPAFGVQRQAEIVVRG
jgi:hypothetical protein